MFSTISKKINPAITNRRGKAIKIRRGSTTLNEVKDKNTTLINKDVTATVNKIKNEQGKDIWLFGGASLVTTFMNEGLVDELELAVHPILLGSGKPLFQNISKRIKLELTNSKVYDSGLVQLFYNVLK